MNISRFCVECGSTHKVYRFNRKIPLCNRHYKQMYRYGKVLERTKFDDNEIVTRDGYMEIVLYDVNSIEVGRAKIDNEDVKKVSNRKWYKNDNDYVVSDTVTRGEFLHRLLTDCPDDKVIDHISRNPLDNRKENLRICTQRENVFNSGLRVDNKVGHTGVVYRKREKKWFSYISIDGRQKSLGYHDDKGQAIKARINGEVKYYGEYAPNA